MTKEQIREYFSENLRKALAKRNKSQADLARYMKVSTATASDWCNEKSIPRTDKIQKIADWLRVDSGALIKKDGLESDYYLNPDTKKIAQEVYDNPSLRILFDASKNLQPDDINFVVDMINRMKGDK